MIIATGNEKTSNGSLIYWSLGSRCSRAKLVAEWTNLGMDEKMLPEATTEKAALGRACKALESKDLMAEAAKDSSGEWHLLVRKQGTFGTRYDTQWKIRPGVNGALPSIEALGSANADDIEDMLHAHYNRELKSLSNTDISSWLVTMAKKLSATALRESGGFYFLPKFSEDTWAKVRTTVQQSGAGMVHNIAAMNDKDAVLAVIDALTMEAKGYAEDVELKAKGVGKRALEARKQELIAYSGKITQYEEILGTKLDQLKEMIYSVQANVSLQLLDG